MALPVMGLCSDSKRSLNLNFFKRNQNPTMFEKGVSVYPTTNGCSASVATPKVSKLHAYFQQTASFHSRTKLLSSDSVIIGGFLGSKSQGRSSNNTHYVWDFICSDVAPTLFQAATEYMRPLSTNKQCDFNLISSPPKKKFAKEDTSSNVDILEKIDFPCAVKLEAAQENSVDGPKQSYAEVARTASCKTSRPVRCLLSDTEKKATVKESGSSRRSQVVHHRNYRRKSNRRDKKGNSFQLPSESVSPQSSGSGFQQETLKDLRLDQQEKHFCQIKSENLNQNIRKEEKHKLLPSYRRGQTSEGLNRSKRHTSFRANFDNKHCSRSKRLNCDIDMINWRTGEPISSKMGTQYEPDPNDEGALADQSSGESSSRDQSRDHSSDGSLWPEIPNASPRSRRRSLSSECSVDSEDSFIVFQSGAPSDSCSDLASDWSDCDSDDSFESDSESQDEVDLCDGLITSSQRLKEVNDRWKIECLQEADNSSYNTAQIEINKEGNRKVHFDKSKPTIHRMLTWDFAYRSSRVGPWEEIARDRARFQTRIQQLEGILSPVLTPVHRKKILKQLNMLQL